MTDGCGNINTMNKQRVGQYGNGSLRCPGRVLSRLGHKDIAQSLTIVKFSRCGRKDDLNDRDSERYWNYSFLNLNPAADIWDDRIEVEIQEAREGLTKVLRT